MKVPVKVVWCVHGWSLLVNEIKAKNFTAARTIIAVGGRYKIHLGISDGFKDKLLNIVAPVYGPDGISPNKATLLVINAKKCVAENKTNHTEFEFPAEEMPFASIDLNRDELERSGILQGKVLKLGFTFSY
ncbi:hypothetical protein MTO96_007638 [Rhipicephalus appendiculatus]